jgi:hypothetical protein
MSDRSRLPVKKSDDILESVFTGHSEALFSGTESGKRYLVNFLEKFNSIPNSVKFFIYDLLAEDAYQVDDVELCRQAVDRAGEYLEEAREKSTRQLAEYMPSLRFIERGISVAVDAGEFESALSLCDLAIQNGLGKAYTAKRASIERMLP